MLKAYSNLTWCYNLNMGNADIKFHSQRYLILTKLQLPVFSWRHICRITPAEKGRAWKGQGWCAVPGGLVCRVGDGCEQGHLRGRQTACHFCLGTCRHQGDRRQCGQDSATDLLSETAAIKPATSYTRSPTTQTGEDSLVMYRTDLLSII